MIAAGPACAVTLRPHAWAVEIAAAISSRVSCGVVICSCSPAMPPEIMSLMRSAPALIWLRTPRANASGPSHSSVSSVSWPCPPVQHSASAGGEDPRAGHVPASIARRSAKSAPPFSATQRTVVTPDSRVRRAPSAMYRASSCGSSALTASPPAPGSESEKCVCMLIRPGHDVRAAEVDRAIAAHVGSGDDRRDHAVRG